MTKKKKPRHVIRRCWVGFSSGHVMKGYDPDYKVETLEVFPTKAAARRCFEDVRKATLVIGGQESSYSGSSISFDLD